MSGSRVEELSVDETLSLLQCLERQRAELDAWQLRALAHMARLGHDPLRDKAPYAGDEVGAALCWSPTVASNRIHEAAELVSRLPETVAALERGELDLARARAIAEATAPLPVEQVREVESAVVDYASGRVVALVRRKLAREVVKLDPEGAEARRQHRRRERTVVFQPREDGMAELSVDDTAERVAAVFGLLNECAQQARGDGRRVGARRADALLDLLLGSNRECLRVELRVTVPASVLAGVSQEPGELHGYGPVTIQVIHELAAHNSVWRRIVTDPVSGSVLDVGRRRFPTAALEDHIKTRDKRCVFPGCVLPAEVCQIDHSQDYVKGGDTTDTNLGVLCAHHNLMKVESEWSVEQPKPGYFIWTSPTGRIYEVLPDPVDE